MRVILKMLAVGILAAGTSVANAAIIPSWNFNVTSIFDVVTGGTTANCQGTACYDSGLGGTVNTAGALHWGAGANGQSGLVIGNSPATGSLLTCIAGVCPPLTPANIGLTQTFTHENRPITGSVLTGVNVITTLNLLTPTVPSGGVNPAPPPVSATFTVHFKETDNVHPCLVEPESNPCPDIFVLTGNLNLFDFFYDSDGPGGPDAPVHYFVSVIETSGTLGPLNPVYCGAVSVSSPCLGFITPEGKDTTFQFGFIITTAPVSLTPEPGTLAIFALGLVALGFTTRRRQL